MGPNRCDPLLASDPLTDILRLTQATSVMAGGIAAGGRWAVHFPPPGEMKISLLAKDGRWFGLDGHKKAIRSEPGDAVLLPGRKGFLVGSDLSPDRASIEEAVRGCEAVFNCVHTLSPQRGGAPGETFPRRWTRKPRKCRTGTGKSTTAASPSWKACRWMTCRPATANGSPCR
ncbi:cupin domain-containing protein [Sorangium sp. So ce1000]|uniref:cupin domain-containing protein n=1 Tax=Sorangium sp. So ce1000 TaxID=3133325 RepID=UPI003F6036D2